MEIMADSHSIFNGFIIGSLIDALIIGMITFLAMLILRIDYPLLVSIIVGVTNIIPYFGPIIGGVVGFLLLIFVDPIKALIFAGLILVIQQFDGNFLKPKIFGQSVGLGPISVIFSIFLFGKLFGFVGMFLGVPIFTIFKNIIDRYLNKEYQKKYRTAVRIVKLLLLLLYPMISTIKIKPLKKFLLRIKSLLMPKRHG